MRRVAAIVINEIVYSLSIIGFVPSTRKRTSETLQLIHAFCCRTNNCALVSQMEGTRICKQNSEKIFLSQALLSAMPQLYKLLVVDAEVYETIRFSSEVKLIFSCRVERI